MDAVVLTWPHTRGKERIIKSSGGDVICVWVLVRIFFDPQAWPVYEVVSSNLVLFNWRSLISRLYKDSRDMFTQTYDKCPPLWLLESHCPLVIIFSHYLIELHLTELELGLKLNIYFLQQPHSSILYCTYETAPIKIITCLQSIKIPPNFSCGRFWGN
jgi:hypothetical protein